MATRTEPLVLERPRELGELVREAFALFAGHFSLFLTLSLIVVAPVVLVVDGIWGRALADGADAEAPLAAQVTSNLLTVLVVQPLVTAMHVRVLLELARGEEPSVGEALRAGLAVFVPSAVAVALYTLGVALGLLLLVVPGIWLGVRWAFAPQAVVVDHERGMGALRHSAAIVQERWWSTFGRLIVVGLVSLAVSVLAGALFAGLGEALDSPPLYVVGLVLATAGAASFGALGATLLFFDRRARQVAAAA